MLGIRAPADFTGGAEAIFYSNYWVASTCAYCTDVEDDSYGSRTTAALHGRYVAMYVCMYHVV